MNTPRRQEFRIRLLDEHVRSLLQHSFEQLERELRLPDLCLTLFHVVLELASNAVKANIKRVYFKKHGYSMQDSRSYEEGLKAFSLAYPTIDENEYAVALDQMHFIVRVEVNVDEDRLLIYVENNADLLEEEERRIRRLLGASMHGVKDIVEFSEHYGDESEGKGLGLAMIVFLMKDMGFNPSHFRVYRENEKTVARLEFPLSANYTPIREKRTTTALAL